MWLRGVEKGIQTLCDNGRRSRTLVSVIWWRETLWSSRRVRRRPLVVPGGWAWERQVLFVQVDLRTPPTLIGSPGAVHGHACQASVAPLVGGAGLLRGSIVNAGPLARRELTRRLS